MLKQTIKSFQLIAAAAIPNYLKRKAQALTAVTNRNILEEWDIFYQSKNKVISN